MGFAPPRFALCFARRSRPREQASLASHPSRGGWMQLSSRDSGSARHRAARRSRSPEPAAVRAFHREHGVEFLPLFGASIRILRPSISNEIELLRSLRARFSCLRRQRRGWPGHRRAEGTPFFERLCPAMTNGVGELPRVDINSDFDRSVKTRRARWRRQTRRQYTRSIRSSC